MAATNTPYTLDGALLRRFDKLIYVSLLNKLSRYKMFQQQLINEEIEEEDLEVLAEKTNGFSGSDINKFCREVKLQPLKRLQKVKFFRLSEDDSGKIIHTPCEDIELGAVEMNIDNLRNEHLNYSCKTTQEEIFNIINRVKPTTSMSTIRRLEKFASEEEFIRSKTEMKEKLSWWTSVLYLFLKCCNN